ncbi:MAG: hypothetical protein P4L56_28055 [Candidatus Sulfopaludibacter sp.]|nr:hypothetical protein [Candidatus Sulfopaludibacter sp.]
MENRPPGKIAAFLAGLQGGMVGILCMLAWLGVSASWLRRSFWTSEDLIARAIYGDAAMQRGFVDGAVSGAALYVLVYAMLGGLFAVVFRAQERQVRVLLLSLAFSMGWYYLSFHVLCRSVLPLVYLLHAERPMVLGHLVYGTFLSRFQNYARK